MGVEPLIPLLFEDEHVLVVDKPPGVLTLQVPGRARASTVVDLVGKQLGQRVFAVHRLDEETSGVLALARTAAAKASLEQVFRSHAAERVYLALVSRAPSPAAGTVESMLEEGPGGVMRSTRGRGGMRAITHFRTVTRRGRDWLVECRLETGRRNQIRVHLAELGCPLCGDRKCGWRPRDGESWPRVMLHAWRLAFRHPMTTAEVEVVAPPPDPVLAP